MKVDLRTREGRKAEVLGQVRDFGGFSIFWVTDNPLRASVATNLQDTGVIVPLSGSFPWIHAELSEPNDQIQP